MQHGVLGLALFALIDILNLLGALLSLDAVILGESALVAGSSSVGEEVRSDGLDASLDSLRELANGLEVLLGAPSAGEGGQRQGTDSYGCHGCDGFVVGGGGWWR